ncbi:MAG: hypothetical protein KJ747_10820 [Actinobacteria bacterium]|nr:hypothetical protein [Actinomycetota bacterium]MCG2806946.1 hypothetical protein [Coriobacteriia bacterium]
MITSVWILVVLTALWAGLTFSLWRGRRWLAFYLTGAFGFVLLAISFMRSLGMDATVEALQAQQVVALATRIGLGLEVLGASGLAIPNHTGWAVFDIGIECSALLEMFAFTGLVMFYPAFSRGRKAGTIGLGVVATWIINLLRILLIVAIINQFGTGWVFPAHAVFGRVFFFAATIAIYWYLVTRPTITIVGAQLDPEEAADE